jgi:meso-butanediol dehydrogenase/(S,S)-butanediol dehydrogenase/diacetyl reductase
MCLRLKGQVAVVTGGGEGLGGAVAERFALEGARVIIADVNEIAGRETARRIQSCSQDALAIKTDVGEEPEVRALAEQVRQKYGRVDILYNNAGVLFHGKDAPAHALCTEIWDNTMRVNVRGLWLCTKYLLPLMMDNGGAIINLGSPTALNSSGAGMTAYSASKGAVLALTTVMANDYVSYKIRVNCIIPGTMDTPMNSQHLADPGVRKRALAKIPLGRFGTGADVAGLAVFLASSEAAYCTGGLYLADGGLCMVS